MAEPGELSDREAAAGPAPDAARLLLRPGHAADLTRLAPSPDGRYLASGAGDGAVRLWDLETGQLATAFDDLPSAVTALVWSPAASWLACGSAELTWTIWSVDDGRLLSRLDDPATRFASLAWSPDGSRLAAGLEDGRIYVWDGAAAGTPPVVLSDHPHRLPVSVLAWDPAGEVLASGAEDGSLRVWRPGDPARLVDGHAQRVTALVWNDRGDHLASADGGGELRVWPARAGGVHRFEGHDRSISAVVWDARRDRLVSCSEELTLRVWDRASRRRLLALEGSESGVTTLDWQGAELRWIVAPRDVASEPWIAEIRRLDPERLEAVRSGATSAEPDEEEPRTHAGHLRRLTARHHPPSPELVWADAAAAFAPVRGLELGDPDRLWGTVAPGPRPASLAWNGDGTRLVSGCGGGETGGGVRLWDLEALRQVALDEPRNGPPSGPLSVTWDPPGRSFATLAADGAVNVWDASGGLRASGGLHPWQGRSLAVGPIVWAELAGARPAQPEEETWFWDADRQRIGKLLAGSTLRIAAVPCAADLFAAGGADRWFDGRRVTLREPTFGEAEAVLRHNEVRLLGTPTGSLTGGGRSAMEGFERESIVVWDASTGWYRRALDTGDLEVSALAWADDGVRLASASGLGEVAIWDARTGRRQVTTGGHGFGVTALAWDAAGERLASADRGGGIKVWDAARGTLLASFAPPPVPIVALAWAADGGRLASGDAAGTVRIWELEGGPGCTVLEHPAPVVALAWRPATSLAVASRGGFLDVWDPSAARRRVRFCEAPRLAGLVVSPLGAVDGPPEALSAVRFAAGGRILNLSDVPERLAPQAVRDAAVKPP